MSIVKDLFLVSLTTPLIVFLMFQSNFLCISLILSIMTLYLLKKSYSLKNELVLQREYFIKTLSHDLRVSTLAQIRALDILKKDTCNDKDLVANISDSCKYTLDMITMLLNTYRYENGEQVLNYETVNLSEFFNDCNNELLPILKDKNIEIDFNLNSFKNIEADKYGLTKLVNILISTAIANSEKGNKIVVKTNKFFNRIEFSINYFGKSLTEEECRRMFSNNPRFSTVGHGIKMLLCKKIIDFHKGSISVISDGQMKNSFVFDLPITKKKNANKTSILTTLQLNNS